MPSRHGPPPPAFRPSYVRDPRITATLADLMGERGRIYAESALRRGDSVGSALENAGQLIGGSIADLPRRQLEESRARREEATTKKIEQEVQQQAQDRTTLDRAVASAGSFDADAIEAQLPGHLRMSFRKTVNEANAAALKFKEAQSDYFARLALGVKPHIGNPEDAAFATNVALQHAEAVGVDVRGLREQIQKDPSKLGAIIDGIIARSPSVAKELREARTPTRVLKSRLPDGSEVEEIVADVPGEKRVSPPEQKQETRGLDVQAADALAKGDVDTYQRLLRVKKEMGQADDRPRITVNTGGLSPTMESNVLNRLQKQYDTAMKPAIELNRQLNLMETGLAESKKGNKNAGQQAVLVTFQKILDPTSVVRESEYARTAAGQALLKRIEGAATRLTQGGAGFTDAEVDQFAEFARQAVRGASSGYTQALRKRVGLSADRYGIPHELVFVDYDLGSSEATQPATGRPTAPSGRRRNPFR